MLVLVLAILAFAAHGWAYIPAVPTNNTNAVNQTDMSTLTLKWSPAGVYSNTVSYQLASSSSNGFSQGALVHFSEDGLTVQNTTTPWIALVNCDSNGTASSELDDIFTLARDRGAISAVSIGNTLLYSTTAEACLINPEYASPDNFEQILDIYATQSRSSAQIINSQFLNLRNSSFGTFNATLLSDSARSIANSIQTNNVTSTYLVATLRAANSTVRPNGTDNSGGNGNGGDPTSTRNNPNTGLAMIILYAITGCVSGLFIIVIISGAIRAIRHPERYGPRAAIMNGEGPATLGQSRTGGIGRAILDTFPIIKFGQGTPEVTSDLKINDLENRISTDRTFEMSSLGPGKEKVTEQGPERAQVTDEAGSHDAETCQVPSVPLAGSSSLVFPRTSDDTAPVTVAVETPEKDVKPSAIGHETCPICIVDFEPGDDLRVLPCEGKHQFHQACVDPWLLELSSSCPLCREDFHALESMMAGNELPESEGIDHPPPDLPGPAASSLGSSRFSKYLRFARRRNRTFRAGSDTSVRERPTTTTADP